MFDLMRRLQSTAWAGLSCYLLATLIGCSESRLPPGETGTVSGRLTSQGEPIGKGTSIVFFDDKTGAVATGVTDDRGDYLLEMKGGLKVMTGTYRISVTAANPSMGMSTEDAMKASVEGRLKPNDEALAKIPARYRSPENSETVFEVKPGANTFDLDMKE